MEIKQLRHDFHCDGSSEIDIWATCETPKDCDVLIEMLKITKDAMQSWKDWKPKKP